jgi:hypothetical protein
MQQACVCVIESTEISEKVINGLLSVGDWDHENA